MKTEMDELRKNTLRQKAVEQVQELHEYLDYTIRRMNAARADYLRSALFETAAAGTWIVTAVAPTPENHWTFTAGWFIWLFLLIRGHFFHTVFRQSMGEVDGSFETLYILGYLERDSYDDGKRRTKKLKTSYFKRFKELFERLNKSKEAYA